MREWNAPGKELRFPPFSAPLIASLYPAMEQLAKINTWREEFLWGWDCDKRSVGALHLEAVSIQSSYLHQGFLPNPEILAQWKCQTCSIQVTASKTSPLPKCSGWLLSGGCRRDAQQTWIYVPCCLAPWVHASAAL